MMTYDPFLNNSQIGQYYGMPAPISLQYATPQTSAMNPAAAQNPFAANQGISSISPNIAPNGFQQVGQVGYPGTPQVNPQQQQQQLQLAAAIPQLFGASPWAIALQNQLLTAALHNPQVSNGVPNQLMNPIFGAQQFGWQQHSPFQQNVSPFGPQNVFPLAPQSWVGQPGFGQVHPLLSQLNARQFQQTPGMYPGTY
jgi:hypothetical protein